VGEKKKGSRDGHPDLLLAIASYCGMYVSFFEQGLKGCIRELACKTEFGCPFASLLKIGAQHALR